MAPPIQKTEDEWQKRLTPEQFVVMRQHGTERPFTGRYNTFNQPGSYVCAACQNPLFQSLRKFDSGCGWPAFDKAVSDSMEYHEDTRFGMKRIEFRCACCGGHLGHIFDDGPTETGERYCVNSVTLQFLPEDESLPPLHSSGRVSSI